MLPQTSKELLNYLIEGNTFAPDELEQFIRGHSDEDQYLDYKDGKITQRQNRNEASKIIREYISGFANSDGGVLIIGIDDSKPLRQISPCERPGGQPLTEWASRCLQGMVAYFSPQPRFQIINCPQGEVLAIAVERAPSLVPCVEAREWKFFFRIGDSTLPAPDYLISDLILGRRQHPLLDLSLYESGFSEEKTEIVIPPANDSYTVTRVWFSLVLENLSFVSAEEVDVGVVSWSLYATEPEINRYLLSYIDVIDVSARSPWRLVRRMSRPTVEWRQTLARFQTLRIPPIGPFDFYFGTLTPVRCAVYVICKGAPPTWFQLDFLCVRGTGGHSHAKLIRKGSERPQVSLA